MIAHEAPRWRRPQITRMSLDRTLAGGGSGGDTSGQTVSS